MISDDPRGKVEGGCLSFSCGCLMGGCLSSLFVVSAALFVFAYGYWVGMIKHPGNYAYIRVRGEEMQPVLDEGDIVLVDRSYYHGDRNRIRRGDIVWLEPTEAMNRESRLLLRVVGLPGETLTLDSSGELQINGEPLRGFSGAAGVPYQATGETHLPVTLGSNDLYVIGDNSAYWGDPRVEGVVPVKNVRGKAAAILYPPHRAGRLD